jgi:hypothetical protein
VVNKPKNKGTRAETAVARYLSASIFPGTERRTQTGRYDKGDMNVGQPIVFEVKDIASPSYPGLLRETETERINALADFGILINKQAGVGYTNVAKWHAVIPAGKFEELLLRGESNPLVHVVPRMARSLDLRIAMIDAEKIRIVVKPATLFSAINVKTQANLEDYFVLTFRDVVVLLARAGYGTAL